MKTATDYSVGTVGQTSACPVGYSGPGLSALSAPAPIPSVGGVFFTNAQVATWKGRIGAGPVRSGAPDDWARISANAGRFLSAGAPTAIPGDPSTQAAWEHGTLVRDAAFVYLLTGDAKYVQPVRDHLMAIAANNDLTKLCIKTPAGVTRDGYAEPMMLLRDVVAYDMIRKALSTQDRITFETWLLRNARFFAAHLQYGLSNLFPRRLAGSYSTRGAAAADGSMDSAYAYRTGSGTLGPRLSVLSQWYNNRRAASAALVGMAGLVLADAELVNQAARYHMEWLTYAVYPDGSEGEYARNGEYGIPRQGTIYQQYNLQSAVMLASALARQGDRSLYQFATSDGLHGTQGGKKSIELAVATNIKLLRKQLDWYYWESAPSSETHLGRMQADYEGSTGNSYHELGLVMAANDLPNVPIMGVVLRDPAVTPEAFPTQSVSTGVASQWSDMYGAHPAMLMLRP